MESTPPYVTAIVSSLVSEHLQAENIHGFFFSLFSLFVVVIYFY